MKKRVRQSHIVSALLEYHMSSNPWLPLSTILWNSHICSLNSSHPGPSILGPCKAPWTSGLLHVPPLPSSWSSTFIPEHGSFSQCIFLSYQHRGALLTIIFCPGNKLRIMSLWLPIFRTFFFFSQSTFYYKKKKSLFYFLVYGLSPLIYKI